MMAGFFLPDDWKSDVTEYSAAYLMSLGKKALLCDIDNTLVTYDDADPTEKIMCWLSSLRKEGITVGFISNNTADRVNRFNRELGLFVYPDAHKPGTAGLRSFMEKTGLHADAVAHVGDQIFTDVCMAHRLGVTALLVPPIRDKKTLFFRFKRLLERPLLFIYWKRQNKTVD